MNAVFVAFCIVEDDSSDGFSDTELHPTPKGQSLTLGAPGSGAQQGLPLRDKKTPTSKLKQPETASGAKKGTRAAVDGAAKKGGVKRGSASVKSATPAKKVRKAVKPLARSAVKGLEVKTVSKTVQRGASKVEEVVDDNELVISLPRPGPTPKTHLPGPIPNAPPTQFLDASSSSSSSSSGSDSSGSGNSSDSNDESGTETAAVKPKVSLSVPSSAPPPAHMDEHAYGIPTKGVPPSSVPASVGGARVVKLPEIKSEQSNSQHPVTAKPTPHRPSVLVVSGLCALEKGRVCGIHVVLVRFVVQCQPICSCGCSACWLSVSDNMSLAPFTCCIDWQLDLHSVLQPCRLCRASATPCHLHSVAVEHALVVPLVLTSLCAVQYMP